MKTDILCLLACLTNHSLAGPLIERQSVGASANEFTQSGCKDILYFFARGSTEKGNMGESVGPPTANGLKDAFGAAVAVEGVEYDAGLLTNALPGGADPAGTAKMKELLESGASQCPASIIVAGGYSQGAAVAHRAIENLDQSVKDKIVGVITYGDTQKKQDNNQILNFPPEKLLIICNDGDLVCSGLLLVLPAHLEYAHRAPEAVAFLTNKIRAAQAA